jgi:rSAM/selenodomain-associated transferase 2
MRLLSVVVPTLNAAAELPTTLARVRTATFPFEIVAADGGSSDATRRIAVEAGARLVGSAPGRGTQLHAGAEAARGDWLLFLHADTMPAPGWAEAVARFTADPANADRAATFRFALDDPHPAARRVERLARWRARALALPYGDQGLLIARPLYDALGGFRPLPLMEDVDLARRLGRQRLTELPVDAATSAARYRRDGWWRRPMRNLLCLTLWHLGVPAHTIARLYR